MYHVAALTLRYGVRKSSQFRPDSASVPIQYRCVTSLVPRLESGEPSSLFCAKVGMLAWVLVCNYAREYHQTWMAALVVYLKLLRRIQLLL